MHCAEAWGKYLRIGKEMMWFGQESKVYLILKFYLFQEDCGNASSNGYSRYNVQIKEEKDKT